MPVHVLSPVVLIIRRSKLYYTASDITSVCGRTVHWLREDCAQYGHLQVWWYQMLY